MSQVLNNYAAQLDQAKMPAGKKKVLQTALTLFANNGFHATTTAKIAKQAGVSEGTIYKYFKSKDDLLGKLLEPILFEIKDNFFATIDDSQSLEELVAFIVADRLEFIEVNFAFIRLIIQEVLTNRLAPQYYGAFFNGITECSTGSGSCKAITRRLISNSSRASCCGRLLAPF